MTLGQRIQQHRKALGLSQEALGERLDVSRQAVSKWETDVAVPDMENLLALAKEFGVSVAELTETPEPVKGSNKRYYILLAVVFTVLLAAFSWTYYDNFHGQSSEPPVPEQPPLAEPIPPPAAAPETDFALLWYGADGHEEFLELGEQGTLFPFGTTLEPTAPVEVQTTDFGGMNVHRADCGAITVGYHHIYEETPVRESVWYLSTMVSDVRTPRGVHPGNTKAQVLAAYGDDLVYCMKEEDGYTFVKHDYYYAYQTPETFGASLQFFMLDGLVAGIRVEHMAELGSTAFAPDNLTRFPLKDGEPDFSLRQEPEQEFLSDARKVYIAWNRLVNDNNLSAEEQYACRRDVFGLLPTMDWSEFGLMGEADRQEDTIFALMNWIANQETFSSSEILWIQMGCTAQGIDGAYADMYSHILAQTLFRNPTLFAKALTAEYPAETKRLVLLFTAYDAEWYPAELAQATQILEAYLADYALSEEEAGWVELLLLYLSTPADDRPALPESP